MRTILVTDEEASKEIRVYPKALPGVKGSIGAPRPGEIIEIKVKEGDHVKPKTPLAVLSAMKMEMVIDSPVEGNVRLISAEPGVKCAAAGFVHNLECLET